MVGGEDAVLFYGKESCNEDTEEIYTRVLDFST